MYIWTRKSLVRKYFIYLLSLRFAVIKWCATGTNTCQLLGDLELMDIQDRVILLLASAYLTLHISENFVWCWVPLQMYCLKNFMNCIWKEQLASKSVRLSALSSALQFCITCLLSCVACTLPASQSLCRAFQVLPFCWYFAMSNAVHIMSTAVCYWFPFFLLKGTDTRGNSLFSSFIVSFPLLGRLQVLTAVSVLIH